jgi:5'-methylthioadenosine phosphorylase
MAKIGIIGGSGLDDPKLLSDFREIRVKTPYGMPSSPLTYGKIRGHEVFIIARHGRKHQIPPTQVNYRANIYALKKQGCEYVIATTACGSLRERIKRGDFVILDQFIDMTRHRRTTFHESFDDGPKHTPMADPFNEELRKILIDAAKSLGLRFHKKGTVVTIEGPRFSTRAESFMFRQLGADVINMSIAPEAILANELGMKYAAIAMSTDYDCWKKEEKPVTWGQILEVFNKNVESIKLLLVKAIEKI